MSSANLKSWTGLLAATGLLGFSVHAADYGASATAPGSLTVAKGFKVELIHNVPKDQEGSWVAMTPDLKGRLIVSDQYGGLFRITPAPIGSSGAAKVEKLAVEVGEAQGLLYAFDSLYVMVANDAYQGRGIYRVRDTKGNDQFDEVKLLRKLEGGGEHGPHSIVLSPDGKTLTIVVGDQTALTKIDSSRVPLRWSEDHLLPRLWDGNGFMKGTLAPGGWIARMSPDGSQWELMANGFRNEYDAAYNRDGDLFTFDADMEWDMNTPWYRPTRVNFVASGGEFGWRSGAGKWPDYYPDSLGSVIDIGPGSPTGVSFGYGAAFPAKYQEAFFINDWSYGKLYAIHLKPDGAGYTAEKEEFITGSPLPLTDIVVNPADHALYFTIGGRRTQSGLYRVTYTGTESTAPVKQNKMMRPALAARRHLESFHGHQDPAAVADAWKFLGSPDRNLRFAARVALEWQPAAQWSEKALAATDPDTAIEAMIALARVSSLDSVHRKATDPKPDPKVADRILTTLDRIDWSKLNERQQIDLLRAFSLAFTRLGEPDLAWRARLVGKFDPHFPSGSRHLNAELAQMLVYLDASDAATKIMAALKSSRVQEEQLDYARFLRVLKHGWTPELHKAYFAWFLDAASFRGGASLRGFLRDMKKDAVANLSPAEMAELKPIIDAQPVIKPPGAALAGRQTVKEWTLGDLAPALDKGLKSGRNFDRGHELFGALCSACHRFSTEGGAVGPDLTGIGGRFSPRDLLESIVLPNKEISDQYGNVVITLKNGDEVVGRIANLNGDDLNIAENMFDPGNFTNVKRQDIVKIAPSKTSPMPEGLLNVLKQDEILDLTSYLLSRGDKANKMFR
jgi:putative heme-binding domain-containing protein